MDRLIVYPMSIPQDTDILNVERNTMIALGWLSQIVGGTGPIAAGFALSASSGSLTLNVGPGVLTSLMTVDARAFGSLAASSAPLVKAGINVAPTALVLTPPLNTGMSINWLIEAQVVEADGTPIVLPFVNSANPGLPFSGPSNSGATLNTVRSCTVALQAVAGAAAATGTQTTPAPSAGWVGLWTVQIDFGASTINISEATPYPTSPIAPFALQSITPGYRHRVRLTSGTSWALPWPHTEFRVTCIGGGGGGLGCQASALTGQVFGAGGGAGATAKKRMLSQTPGTVFTYAIGAAGTAGAGTGTATAGGTTSFSLGATVECSAGGGQPGVWLSSSRSAGGQGGAVIASDTGDGDPGGWGKDGQNVFGSTTLPLGGGGGDSSLGGGGRAGDTGGEPGAAAGSGGGGAYDSHLTNTSYTGGAGAAGCIIIEY